MVNSKKSVMTKAAAIAMSITMLTSALSFGVSASAEELDDTTTTTTTSTTSTGPVVACPIEDGVLYISIEGGQWKHWIEYASGESTSGYGTLDIKTIDGVETFIYSDIDGNVIIQWDEEKPSNSGSRADITDVEEEEVEEETGEIDFKIAEKLLNMLYEEQRALSEEASYFKDMQSELKTSVAEASSIKSILRKTMSNEEMSDIAEYISAAKKQKEYAAVQYKRFNAAALRCGYEIRNIEKRLKKNSTIVDVSGGEGATEKYVGTGGLSFWKSSAYQNAASKSYGEVTDNTVILSDDEKIFLSAISEKNYGIISVKNKTETYYLRYYPTEKAVYRVTSKGRRISDTPEYNSVEIAKGLFKNYKTAYDNIKQRFSYDYAVYTAAASFYEEKGILLREKYDTIMDYKSKNSISLSKSSSKVERDTLDLLTATLTGAGRPYYKVMVEKNVVKVLNGKNAGENKIRYSSSVITLYKYAAKAAAKYAKNLGVAVDTSLVPEGNAPESDG